MKPITLIFFICSCLLLDGCGRGQTVDGHTLSTAYRSVKRMKERVPPESRMEFEVSFWTIRDANKDNEAFLDAVDGKSAFQVIEAAKEIYQERKASGFELYKPYKTWEEMIANYDKIRMNQDKTKVAGSAGKRESRDFDSPNTTILYNFRAPQK